MPHYAIYIKLSKALTGEPFPIIISKDESLLIKYLTNNCYMQEITFIPHPDNICAKGAWQKIQKDTFAFSDKNPHNLEIISHKDLSALLSSS